MARGVLMLVLVIVTAVVAAFNYTGIATACAHLARVLFSVVPPIFMVSSLIGLALRART